MLDSSLIIGVAVVIGMYLLFKILALPIRLLWKVLWNALIGWIALFLVNSLAPWTGFAVPVTFWTALGVGIFGLPGLVALIVYIAFLR